MIDRINSGCYDVRLSEELVVPYPRDGESEKFPVKYHDNILRRQPANSSGRRGGSPDGISSSEPIGSRSSNGLSTNGGQQQQQLTCVVHMLDDVPQEFVVEKNAVGEQLLTKVYDSLNLLERDFFGLQFISLLNSNTARMRWLDPKKSIKRQIVCPPYQLFFRVKFYTSDPKKLTHDHTRYLLYLQIRRDLLDGKLCCDNDMAVLLASLAAQAEYGDVAAGPADGGRSGNDDQHLRDFRFLPAEHPTHFMRCVARLHAIHCGMSAADARLHFVVYARQLNLYGYDFYDAKDANGRSILLGANAAGISVVERYQLLNTFPWRLIVKLSFKRKTFFLRIKAENEAADAVETELSFNALCARNCKMLWKSCVEHHAFFRLAVAPPPQTPGGGAGGGMAFGTGLFHLGSRFRYSAALTSIFSGRTEFQALQRMRRVHERMNNSPFRSSLDPAPPLSPAQHTPLSSRSSTLERRSNVVRSTTAGLSGVDGTALHSSDAFFTNTTSGFTTSCDVYSERLVRDPSRCSVATLCDNDDIALHHRYGGAVTRRTTQSNGRTADGAAPNFENHLHLSVSTTGSEATSGENASLAFESLSWGGYPEGNAEPQMAEEAEQLQDLSMVLDDINYYIDDSASMLFDVPNGVEVFMAESGRCGGAGECRNVRGSEGGGVVSSKRKTPIGDHFEEEAEEDDDKTVVGRRPCPSDSSDVTTASSASTSSLCCSLPQKSMFIRMQDCRVESPRRSVSACSNTDDASELAEEESLFDAAEELDEDEEPLPPPRSPPTPTGVEAASDEGEKNGDKHSAVRWGTDENNNHCEDEADSGSGNLNGGCLSGGTAEDRESAAAESDDALQRDRITARTSSLIVQAPPPPPSSLPKTDQFHGGTTAAGGGAPSLSAADAEAAQQLSQRRHQPHFGDAETMMMMVNGRRQAAVFRPPPPSESKKAHRPSSFIASSSSNQSTATSTTTMPHNNNNNNKNNHNNSSHNNIPYNQQQSVYLTSRLTAFRNAGGIITNGSIISGNINSSAAWADWPPPTMSSAHPLGPPSSASVLFARRSASSSAAPDHHRRHCSSVSDDDGCCDGLAATRMRSGAASQHLPAAPQRTTADGNGVQYSAARPHPDPIGQLLFRDGQQMRLQQPLTTMRVSVPSHSHQRPLHASGGYAGGCQQFPSTSAAALAVATKRPECANGGGGGDRLSCYELLDDGDRPPHSDDQQQQQQQQLTKVISPPKRSPNGVAGEMVLINGGSLSLRKRIRVPHNALLLCNSGDDGGGGNMSGGGMASSRLPTRPMTATRNNNNNHQNDGIFNNNNNNNAKRVVSTSKSSGEVTTNGSTTGALAATFPPLATPDSAAANRSSFPAFDGAPKCAATRFRHPPSSHAFSPPLPPPNLSGNMTLLNGDVMSKYYKHNNAHPSSSASVAPSNHCGEPSPPNGIPFADDSKVIPAFGPRSTSFSKSNGSGTDFPVFINGSTFNLTPSARGNQPSTTASNNLHASPRSSNASRPISSEMDANYALLDANRNSSDNNSSASSSSLTGVAPKISLRDWSNRLSARLKPNPKMADKMIQNGGVGVARKQQSSQRLSPRFDASARSDGTSSCSASSSPRKQSPRNSNIELFDSSSGGEAVAVRLAPDVFRNSGLQITGGTDCAHPSIVSKVSPGITPLNEGDQVLSVNGQDISSWSHSEVQSFMSRMRERAKDLVLIIKPNVYRCAGLVDDENSDGRCAISAGVLDHLIDPYCGVSNGEAETSCSNNLETSLLKVREIVQHKQQACHYFEQVYRKKPTATMCDALAMENLGKNRYRDVCPYDETRVKLKQSPSGNYINANHVNMEIKSSGIVNRYIATQGPLPNTAVDFWYMVWEQNSTTIAMLTTLKENDRVKCHQYWPNVGQTTEYGSLQITNVFEREDEKTLFQYRELSIRHKITKVERLVTQMQYTTWPDHGVPANPRDFVKFVGEVRRARNGSIDPIIVHCSAGIGRTGVLIMMETAMCMIEANEPIYPLDMLRTMRDQRAMLIQTSEQFKFVCESILSAYNEKNVKPLSEYQPK